MTEAANDPANLSGTGLGSPRNQPQDAGSDQKRRVEELENRSLDWLRRRAKEFGIPEWSELSKSELVQRLAETSAPPH